MMDSVLTDPRHERLLVWLLTAPAEREPKTLQAFAESQGVAPRTTRDWQAKPAFQLEWKARFKEIAGSQERTKMIIDQLFEDGMSQDNSAAERKASLALYYQITKELAPPEPEVSVSARAQDLSDDELRDLVALGAAEELKERIA